MRSGAAAVAMQVPALLALLRPCPIPVPALCVRALTGGGALCSSGKQWLLEMGLHPAAYCKGALLIVRI